MPFGQCDQSDCGISFFIDIEALWAIPCLTMLLYIFIFFYRRNPISTPARTPTATPETPQTRFAGKLFFFMLFLMSALISSRSDWALLTYMIDFLTESFRIKRSRSACLIYVADLTNIVSYSVLSFEYCFSCSPILPLSNET